jgi:hypothetical protein
MVNQLARLSLSRRIFFTHVNSTWGAALSAVRLPLARQSRVPEGRARWGLRNQPPQWNRSRHVSKRELWPKHDKLNTPGRESFPRRKPFRPNRSLGENDSRPLFPSDDTWLLRQSNDARLHLLASVPADAGNMAEQGIRSRRSVCLQFGVDGAAIMGAICLQVGAGFPMTAARSQLVDVHVDAP